MSSIVYKLTCLFMLLTLCGCDERAWNNAYPNQPAVSNTLYTAFDDQPKHLDPAISYSSDEWQFLGQIYEPVLQYSYLLRPYQLQPLISQQMPIVKYDSKTDTSTYVITIKPEINYQPHPALAKDAADKYYYHHLTRSQAEDYTNIQDFEHTGTRELIADDYVYQIKRLADPTLNSPIFGFFSKHIVGFAELRATLQAEYKNKPEVKELDLRPYDFAGARVIDKYTYEIKIHGKYAQFKYWLAMPFFSPVPWEATVFYAQPGMETHNLSLDGYPIGTGAYYLTTNNPQRHLILQRNPNFHVDYYPTQGMPGDEEKGLLSNAGKHMPFIDKVIFSLEKESIPYWDKFLQGYYDRSGISSDSFNSAISNASRSSLQLTQPLIDKGIRLAVSNTLSTFYWGFNMQDDVVGGSSERSRQLRQAISLAFDVQEYIAIFANERAELAGGPIPPGILGYEADQKLDQTNNLQRAQKLMVAAGYLNGIDPITGKPLQIYFDTITSGDPSENAVNGWVTKQFSKLGIDLVCRASDYNRFQDKLHTGTVQFFSFGWIADYPDPENFLFLFYGQNTMVGHDGENITNYRNKEFDRIFERFKEMGDDPARINLIKQMLAILQYDTPWVWGFFPQSYGLYNQWIGVTKPNGIANNTLKYMQIDPDLRAKLCLAWNQPIIWPLFIVVLLVLIILAPALLGYIKSNNATAKRMH